MFRFYTENNDLNMHKSQSKNIEVGAGHPAQSNRRSTITGRSTKQENCNIVVRKISNILVLSAD